VARSPKSGTLVEVRQGHLILITGLPGTGKSTLARMIASRYGLPLICKDTIKEPLFDVIGASHRAGSRRLSDASFAVMFALARECLGGTDLILEGNFRVGEHEPAVEAVMAALSVRNGGPVRAGGPLRVGRPLRAGDALTAGDALRAGDGVRAAEAVEAGEAVGAGDAVGAGEAATAAQALTGVRLAQLLCRAAEPVRIARLHARTTDPSRHPAHRDADMASAPSPPPSDFLALPGERFTFDSDARSAAEVDSFQLQALLDALDRWREGGPIV
jgi:predicted kinase